MRPDYRPEPVDLEDNMPKERRVFSISGGNKGLLCPFKSTICQEGFCHECQIYLDWQKPEEIMVVCAWCGKKLGRKNGVGQSGVSHGICLECQQKHFPKILSRDKQRENKTSVKDKGLMR